MDGIAALVAANTTFVGSHFLLSHPARAGMVKAIGDKGFLGVYSLVSLASFAWIVIAFRSIGPGGAMLWNGASDALWALGSVLTILALVLLLGSLRGNPALPDTPVASVEHAEATGVFAVTRHPMMWAIAIWAAAHILVWPSPRTLVTAGAMGVLALLGAHLQDRKKEALLGEAWKRWEAQTSYWPHPGALAKIGLGLWVTAFAAWLALTALHLWLAGIPAGIWRWVG